MKVVILDTDFPDLQVERPLASRHGVDLEVAGPQALSAIDVSVAGLVTMWTPVDEAMIDSLPDLRVVGRFGLGLDAIDVGAASRRGIAVVNSGDYATEEVAVHTVGLVLALVRQIVGHDSNLRRGGWLDRDVMRGMRRLSELTAGVVGLGKIGCRVANMLSGLGMDVVGYDPAPSVCDVRRADSLVSLLEMSDVITLHVPLTDRTRDLLGRAEIGSLRQGALIVNCSRGGVMDYEALVEGLASGDLGGAGLDVFPGEPSVDERLRAMSNVVLTPHVAYYSPHAIRDARERTIRGVLAVLIGERPPNQVN